MVPRNLPGVFLSEGTFVSGAGEEMFFLADCGEKHALPAGWGSVGETRFENQP